MWPNLQESKPVVLTILLCCILVWQSVPEIPLPTSRCLVLKETPGNIPELQVFFSTRKDCFISCNVQANICRSCFWIFSTLGVSCTALMNDIVVALVSAWKYLQVHMLCSRKAVSGASVSSWNIEEIPFSLFPILSCWVNATWDQGVRMAFWHQIEIKSHFFLLSKFP